MPHNLTEASTFDAAVTVPDDGDQREAASVETGFQQLANRTRRLKDQKLGDGVTDIDEALTVNSATGSIVWSGTAAYPGLGSRTVNRIQDVLSGFSASSWTITSVGGLWRESVLGTDELMLALNNLVDGGTLVSVVARIDGNLGGGGDHGALPAVMPRLGVFRRDDAAIVQLGSYTTDTSGSVSAYETPHELTVASLSEAIDETKAYYAFLRGENSTNAIANSLALISLRCTFTVTSVRPGG